MMDVIGPLRRSLGIVLVAWGAMLTVSAAEQPAGVPAESVTKPDYARDIQPLFEKHCYACHGAKKQEAGLRLDQRSAALEGGELGSDILPGRSAESRLWAAIAGTSDEVSRMPAKSEPLSAAEIALVKSWIDQGAPWPETAPATVKDPRKHWAFQAPVRPAVPPVRNAAWAENDVDRFILARLEAKQLAPSRPADKVTLLRRMSLDLIGLPPTIAEVDAFLADGSPNAYEKQVERLLASPHYGERWGRHWLDAARYADSDGFEKDKSRNVWMYRDWVIGAINRDLPYDRFIVEQLAGDQLPGATQDGRVATGFLRNSMLNEEGGIDPEQFRMEAMFDRMDALGKSVLGLTIQCCQCHNHKFDPLTQEEYYRLLAFLNNDHESQATVYTPEELMARDELLRAMRGLEAELQRSSPDWPDRMAAWEEQLPAGPEWEVLVPEVYEDSGGGAKLSLLPDNSMLCAGYAPTRATFRVVAKTRLASVSAVRLELLTDPNLPRGGPGRSFKGTCALTQIKVEARPAEGDGKNDESKIKAATADFEQDESPLEANFDDRSGKKRIVGPVALAIDGKDETAWGIDAGAGRRNQDRKAVFQLEKPIEFAPGAVLTVSLVQNHGGWNSDDHQNNLLGRFRISVTSAQENLAADPLPKRVREILSIERASRSQAQNAEVFAYWRSTLPEWKEVNERIEAQWRRWPAGTTALVLQSRGAPRETRMLKRGDFLKPQNAVTPGVPAILHPLPPGALEPGAQPSRLTLARWLTDRASPTTARVAVNRIWQAYFGTGIVSTSEDFGVQSEPPSHGGLLDWLACEFMDRGWSMKAMHRLIVHSATYRQSSRVTPESYARDQYNRLLARGPRFRVEGEIVRDIALAASGRLNAKVGGPSIFAPIPESLLALSYAPLTWNAETGPDRYRRALYTFRRRSLPYPALQNFDTPNADSSCVRRQRSNTPLQALTTLNEVIFTECARALAHRTLESSGPNDVDRVTFAFRSCLARRPTDEECRALVALVDRQRARIADGWTNAREIATGKNELPDNLPPGATPAQLAAYTVLARVILNLDETITKE
jgi:mono/diheme cytochrome c family protein